FCIERNISQVSVCFFCFKVPSILIEKKRKWDIGKVRLISIQPFKYGLNQSFVSRDFWTIAVIIQCFWMIGQNVFEIWYENAYSKSQKMKPFWPIIQKH